MTKGLSIIFLALALATVLTSFRPKSFHPPGTVQINDTLWYDKAEISNFAWREYVAWTRREYGADSPQYKKSLPDTLVWRNKLAYNEPYVNYYFRHSAYQDYPVVGISYEQAIDYCQWRTSRVKEFLKKENPGKTYVFEYRLPERSEWHGVSLLGWGKKAKMMMRSGKYDVKRVYNFRLTAGDKGGVPGSTVNQNADITAPCISNFPNEKELYNLYGNVSEMVQEKGMSVGGGWIHTQDQAGFNSTIPYDKPQSWLGFRCVCVVKNP